MLHRLCLILPTRFSLPPLRVFSAMVFVAVGVLLPAQVFATIRPCSGYAQNGGSPEPINEATAWLRIILGSLKEGRITIQRLETADPKEVYSPGNRMREYLPIFGHKVSFSLRAGGKVEGRIVSFVEASHNKIKVVLVPALNAHGIQMVADTCGLNPGAPSPMAAPPTKFKNSAPACTQTENDPNFRLTSGLVSLDQIDIESVYVIPLLNSGQVELLVNKLSENQSRGKIVSFTAGTPPESYRGWVDVVNSKGLVVEVLTNLKTHDAVFTIPISEINPASLKDHEPNPFELENRPPSNPDQSPLAGLQAKFSIFKTVKKNGLPVTFKVKSNAPLGYTIHETIIADISDGDSMHPEPTIRFKNFLGENTQVNIEDVFGWSIQAGLPSWNLSNQFPAIAPRGQNKIRAYLSDSDTDPSPNDSTLLTENPKDHNALQDTLAVFADPSKISGPTIPKIISGRVNPGSTLRVYFGPSGRQQRLTIRRLTDGGWRMSISIGINTNLYEPFSALEQTFLDKPLLNDMEAANRLRQFMRTITSHLINLDFNPSSSHLNMEEAYKHFNTHFPDALRHKEVIDYFLILNDLKFNITSGIHRSPTTEPLPLRTRQILAGFRYYINTNTVYRGLSPGTETSPSAPDPLGRFIGELRDKGLRFIGDPIDPKNDRWDLVW